MIKQVEAFLEHLIKPWEFLAFIQKQFKLADTFVIEVPNTDEILKTIYKNEAYSKNHYHSEHLYYFNSKTLRQIVEFANLEVIFDSQMQRYSLANHLGWMLNNKGGGQDIFEFLNDEKMNNNYEKVLVSRQLADSVFFICKTNN